MNYKNRTKPKNTTPYAEPETGRVIAEALALQQTHAQLPESLRLRLSAVHEELERVVKRVQTLLVEVARRTPPDT